MKGGRGAEKTGRSIRYPEANLALEVFLRLIRETLGSDLLSVVLYGSIVYEDLAPGYGDLDFLAVTASEIDENLAETLIALRQPFRSGDHGVVATMIEGPFLPKVMIDPSVRGRAVWWGTSGERTWTRNELGPLVMHHICRHGIVIWGDDVRGLMPPFTPEGLIEETQGLVRRLEEGGTGGTLHSVDWLLTAARMLRLIREGDMGSKNAAAEWGLENLQGEWRKQLPRAGETRRNPHMADDPDVKAWLSTLTPHIREACDELETELAVMTESRS